MASHSYQTTTVQQLYERQACQEATEFTTAKREYRPGRGIQGNAGHGLNAITAHS